MSPQTRKTWKADGSDSTTTSGQSFTCASGVAVSIHELAEFIIEETGSPREIEFEPSRAGDIEHFLVDSGPIRELGIEFDTDWRALVREVIAWISASGAAPYSRALAASLQWLTPERLHRQSWRERGPKDEALVARPGVTGGNDAPVTLWEGRLRRLPRARSPRGALRPLQPARQGLIAPSPPPRSRQLRAPRRR